MVINVPKEEVEQIQHYDLRRSAIRDIMLHILANETEILQDRWEKLKDEYTDEFEKFERAKQELENKYILPDFADKNVTWNLNYATGELTIIENEAEKLEEE